ncbi:asparagine synthase-related protein [Nonomuraea angiospora]|uniref:asparagine synthase-related protein n=1 Tax=Nonomuraea angiospora TaxID=46172 RepID=UPI0029B665D6|nr:asparagine synthase-related protein [Nonomuraea angiospora]MDX3107073.1 asparagine synthase-related protein [Nonomuraea angiospora]
MRGAEHLVWPAEESPLVYEDLLRIDDTLDEPTIGVMDRARVLAHLPRLAARGSRLHVTGIGGDHVAWCSEASYHRLLLRRPMLAIGRLRGFRALLHWPYGPMLRTLADRRSYRRWLTGSLPRPARPDVAAGGRRAGLGNATPALPVDHSGRGPHGRRGARIRQWDQMSVRAGLPMTSPFLDDRVIEACLSVHPQDRVTPWRYKPLLTAAMRGVVPEECLRRTSKAEASLDAAEGLRRHGPDVQALWADSRLARLGLVDTALLKDLTAHPDTPELREAILYSTIGCEVWLRTLEPFDKEDGR